MSTVLNRRRALSVCLLVVGFLASSWAAAQSSSVRVYRSIDANGSVRFSDQPPAAVQQAEVIELPVVAPQHDPAVQQRQQAAREVTDRIAADRQQREAQRQRVYRVEAEPVAPPPSAALPPIYPWVVWPAAPQHPHYLPPRRARPPGSHWDQGAQGKPSEWRALQRNPYPYSVIRSRYRGAAGEVFNPRN